MNFELFEPLKLEVLFFQIFFFKFLFVKFDIGRICPERACLAWFTHFGHDPLLSSVFNFKIIIVINTM